MKPREKGFPILNKKGSRKRKEILWALTKLVAVWYLFLGIVVTVTGHTNAYYTDIELVNQEIQIGTWEIADDTDCSNNEDNEECGEMEEPIEEKQDSSSDNQENEGIEPEKEESEETNSSNEKVDDSTKEEIENKPDENEAIDKEKEESELPIDEDPMTKEENTAVQAANKPGGEGFEKNAENNK